MKRNKPEHVKLKFLWWEFETSNLSWRSLVLVAMILTFLLVVVA